MTDGDHSAIGEALGDPQSPLSRAIDSIQAMIEGKMREVEKESRRNSRMTAILWNKNAPVTDSASFEVVPFPNETYDDPTRLPHNLPALNSRLAVKALTQAQLAAYIRGYMNDQHYIIPEDVNKGRQLIFKAIGARRGFDEDFE